CTTPSLHSFPTRRSSDLLSSTIINQVFATGQSLVTMDAMVDPRFSGAKSVMMGGIRSTMVVPMIYQSQLFGIIHLDSLIAVSARSEEHTSELQSPYDLVC